MNILMLTNTYKPIVGGLEKSVEMYATEYRERGHKVLIIAPEYKGQAEEEGVFRMPAIQNFNGTDFSVEVPVSYKLNIVLQRFRPDIVHTHHPFLIGDTALRISSQYALPLVFTHHTLYEENVHYVPGNAELMKKFVIQLSTGYANLCDYVFAPSQSVFDLIKERGVKTEMDVIPTGIKYADFAAGQGDRIRTKLDIPKDCFLVGYIGRVAPEKNMRFLAPAVASFLEKNEKAGFLLVGKGQSRQEVQDLFRQRRLEGRLYTPGLMEGQELIDAYSALDVFVFASHSETQGLVLIEAMAAGVPVVGVDAPGVREVVNNQENGRLLKQDNEEAFMEALQWVQERSPEEYGHLSRASQETARQFDLSNSVEKALHVYTDLIARGHVEHEWKNSRWEQSLRLIKAQMDLILNITEATKKVVTELTPEQVKQVRKAYEKYTQGRSK